MKLQLDKLRKTIEHNTLFEYAMKLKQGHESVKEIAERGKVAQEIVDYFIKWLEKKT